MLRQNPGAHACQASALSHFGECHFLLTQRLGERSQLSRKRKKERRRGRHGRGTAFILNHSLHGAGEERGRAINTRLVETEQSTVKHPDVSLPDKDPLAVTQKRFLGDWVFLPSMDVSSQNLDKCLAFIAPSCLGYWDSNLGLCACQTYTLPPSCISSFSPSPRS